jgi:stage III sporulation protein SpoIIIAA
MKFDVIFKKGTKAIVTIEGYNIANLVLNDEVTNKIVETEQFLERLTGYRVHIE